MALMPIVAEAQQGDWYDMLNILTQQGYIVKPPKE
jgi:hypothetical protein